VIRPELFKLSHTFVILLFFIAYWTRNFFGTYGTNKTRQRVEIAVLFPTLFAYVIKSFGSVIVDVDQWQLGNFCVDPEPVEVNPGEPFGFSGIALLVRVEGADSDQAFGERGSPQVLPCSSDTDCQVPH
jgi:hypothetical protein